MLYLVSTPIGNLADISIRALDLLKQCDYILCEDTRHSLIFLRHYDIRKPLKSYHQFNESARSQEVLEDLAQGQSICLISDAGTPGIADPGSILVKQCIARGLPVTAIPGPCAALCALSCSGLPTERFLFWGFLPRKHTQLCQELQTIFNHPYTTVCYESPQRLLNVLGCIHSMQPQRQLVVGRELTKKFEELQRGCAAELIEYWQSRPLKGEIVLLIAPLDQSAPEAWKEWSPAEHIAWVQEHYALNRKEALKLVAELRGVPKRELYHSTLPHL